MPAPRLLSCITCEILVCICLTLPTVFGSLSPPPEVRPRRFPSCFPLISSVRGPLPRLPVQLVIVLSLASLSHACSLTVSLLLASLYPPTLSTSLSISCPFLLITAQHPPPHPRTYSLSVLTPRGKRRYVNCFPLDGCPACYLSILMNCPPPNLLKAPR